MTELALSASGEPLARIAEYEAMRQQGMFPKMVRWIGRYAAFAFIYRRVGPIIDPWILKRQGGWLHAWYGMPALLLTVKGAKSGLPRSSPLLYVRDGEDFLVVGTNFGQAHHPAWTNNLVANPRASVKIGAAEVPVDGAAVGDDEFKRQWPRFVEVYPGYQGYLDRSGRHPRMFRLKPARS